MKPRQVIRMVAFSLTTYVLAAASIHAQSVMHRVREVVPESLASLRWSTLASDPKGDGVHARLPHATECAIDRKTNTVWFKVTLYDPVPDEWLGISVAVDNDRDPTNGALWWRTQ